MTEIITLSDRDRDLLLKELENPSPPNKALRKAAERFKKRYGKNSDELTRNQLLSLFK